MTSEQMLDAQKLVVVLEGIRNLKAKAASLTESLQGLTEGTHLLDGKTHVLVVRSKVVPIPGKGKKSIDVVKLESGDPM